MTTPSFSQYSQKNKPARGSQSGAPHYPRRDDHSNSHRRPYDQQRMSQQPYMPTGNTQHGSGAYKLQNRGQLMTTSRSAEMPRYPHAGVLYSFQQQSVQSPYPAYDNNNSMVMQNRPAYGHQNFNLMNTYVGNQGMNNPGYNTQMNVAMSQPANMAFATMHDRSSIQNRTTPVQTMPHQAESQNMNNPMKAPPKKKKSHALTIVDPNTKEAVNVNDTTQSNNFDSNIERSIMHTKQADNNDRRSYQSKAKGSINDSHDVISNSTTASNKEVSKTEQDKEIQLQKSIKSSDDSSANADELPTTSESGKVPVPKTEIEDDATKVEPNDSSNLDNIIDQPNMASNNCENEVVKVDLKDVTDGISEMQVDNTDDKKAELIEEVVVSNDSSAPAEDGSKNAQAVVEEEQKPKPSKESLHKPEADSENIKKDEPVLTEEKGTESFIEIKNQEPTMEDEQKSDTNDDQSQSDDDSLEQNEESDEGNRHYDREFLLKFRAMGPAQARPDLPNVECVLKEGSNIGDVLRHPADFVLPPYSRQKSSGSGKGRSQRGSKKIIDHSISTNITLKKADNKWQRPSEERDEDKIILNKVKAILNKLTPQKFDVLVGNFKELTIDNEARLMGAIDLIFEKAIAEPSFNRCYAQLCLLLQDTSIQKGADGLSGKSKNVTLRRLILNKCQAEFSKTKSFDSNKAERKEKRLAECNTNEEKRRVQEELDIEEIKARKRSLGNVKFIGELFKLGMLKENIIHQDCLVQLFRNSDEDSLESLCGFMTSVGKLLDRPDIADRMDQYFDRLKKLTQKKDRICARMRFMIQDVIDLRQNNWVPRRADNNPKKIDEIHREVEKEAAMQEEQLRAHQPREKNMPRNRGRGNDMDDRRQNYGASRQRMDRSEINVSKFMEAANKKDEAITLGPPSWIKKTANNSGGSPRTNQSKDLHSKHYKAQGSTSGIMKERSAISHDRKRDNANIKENNKLTEVSSDRLLSIVEEVFEEYRNNGDFKGPVQELSDKSNFVDKLVNHVLDKKDEDQKAASLLLQVLFEDSIIPSDDYSKAFVSILDAATDVAIDVPLIYRYLAKLFSPLIPSCVSLQQLIKIAKNNVIASCNGHKLICEILVNIKDIKGVDFVSKVWADSGVSVSDFTSLDSAKVLRENGLEFLIKPKISSEEIEDEILRMLENRNDTAVQQMDQLLNTYAITHQLEDLLHKATIAICRSCVKGNNCDEGKLKKNIVVLDSVLKKFYDTNKGGLACLSRIEEFVSGLGHPPDLLAKIFNSLYDFESINEATFKEWLDDKKSRSPEVARSLSHFIDRIEKGDVESE